MGPADVQYLSEDEAGGGGAAVRPLQPAASGVGPSVSLVGTKYLCVIVLLSYLPCVSPSIQGHLPSSPPINTSVSAPGVGRAVALSSCLLSSAMT